jgi:hypothetical protein
MDERLKHAIAAGDFAAALELFPAYTGWLEAELRRLPATSDEARRLAAGAHTFFRWARTTVLCGRAQCAARLEQAGRLGVYLHAAPVRTTWQMKG